MSDIDVNFKLEPDVTFVADLTVETGTINTHGDLSGRELPDQHPMTAITGLEEALFNKQDIIPNIDTIRTNAQDGKTAYDTIQTYGNIVTHNINEFATANQGELSLTALQPNDNISELTNNVGYITNAALDGYATENFVTSQGYITGITSNDVTTALGYTPYNSNNPAGYITDSALNGYATETYVDTGLATKQATLVSGTNIKTVNNESLLGSGNINIESGAVDSVNGQTGDVVLTASDVGALPSSTTIPTKTSDLTNDSGYITGITSSDVTSALGYTPYNSTNPNGYIDSSALNGYATETYVDTGLATKQNTLTADNAGTGISIENGVISNTQTSAEWGNIEGDITDQTDLIELLDTKQDKLTSDNAGTDIEIVNGEGGDNTVSGNGFILLEKAVADGLNYVTLSGACEQTYLPLGYTLVDGITNTSIGAKIDTGIVADTTAFEMEVRVKPSSGSWYIFQSRGSSEGITGIGGSTSGSTIAGYYLGTSVTSAITRDTSHIYFVKLTLNNGNMTLYVKDETANVEDTQTTTYSTSDTPTENLYLWGTSQNNLVADNTIYMARLKKNGVTVLDYTPCIYNNTAGFYDTASKSFKTKTSVSGAIVAGDVLPNPTNPLPIVSNNGELKVDNQGQIYTDGTQETVTDGNGNTATAEMLLSIGNYTDTQEILTGAVTRKVGVKVFDGTENWELHNNISNTYRLDDVFTDLAQGVPILQSAYCTHFNITNLLATNDFTQGLFRWAAVSVGTVVTVTSGTRLYMCFGFGTVAEVKQYLAQQYANGTPVIIVYPLATETTETVTGQTLTTVQGDNTLTITQASIDNLPIEANYDVQGGLLISFVNDSGFVTDTNLTNGLATKQDTLVSGTNIKTINNQSLLGSGNIDIQGGGSAVDSVNGQTGTVVLTASDVGALADTTTIPTKTSDLTNDSGYITNSAIANMQTTTNLVTSVSSSSTDSQYPSAKLFYDTCGDIETLINAL